MSALTSDSSVAPAKRDASLGGVASDAPSAAWPSCAASPSPARSAWPSANELTAVRQSIERVEHEIDAVEKEITEAKKARNACPEGSELRQESTAELQRLSKKEDRLRDEKAQLRDELKRKELALERTAMAAPPLDLSPLLGVIARIEAGQQALTAEVRALGAQAQSPSRAQDGERAWQLCPDQSEGLPPAIVAAALQRAAERGAQVSDSLSDQPIISPSDLQAIRSTLPKASWELELIVLVTPHVRAVTQRLASANDYLLVNSEVYAWIQTPVDNSKLWQKPDMFLCHRSAYMAASPPGQDSENAQWLRATERMAAIGAEQFQFGRCAWPLRDVMECFFEGKRERLSVNQATGECLAKARNLLYRSAQERSFITPRQVVKCVMFDQENVYLLHFDSSPEGGLRAARKFGWSTPGSLVVLLDFLQPPPSLTPNWLRVLRSSLSHFDCHLRVSDSFLGHGGTGRVFEVFTGEFRYALKVVETGSADDRVAVLEAELQHLHNLRLVAAESAQGLALLPSSPDREVLVCDDTSVFPPRPCGAAVRFAPIGQSVALAYPKDRSQSLWQAVSSALWVLHSHNCYHGDARLENLILVPKLLESSDSPASSTRAGPSAERLSWKLGEAQLVWIDFRESSVLSRRHALDCHTLLCSFFRIPTATTARDPRVASLVHGYEELWEQPVVTAVGAGAAAGGAKNAAWQDSAWRTLGAGLNPSS